MSVLGFQMWEPYRQLLLAEHRFYVDQARKRLLSQFDDKEGESDKAANAHLEKMSTRFDPDKHDPADAYEEANDKGIEFYLLLSDMHESTRLSVIAGMFHHWDKKLREWIVGEIRHWCSGENAIQAIWRVDFPAIMDILEAIGFNVKMLPCFDGLNAMRLVVNVFKHGNGASFDELKISFPEYISDPFDGVGDFSFSLKYQDHTHMKVSDFHFEVFSESILDFWKSVPEAVYLPEDLHIPKWLEKAINKDRITA